MVGTNDIKHVPRKTQSNTVGKAHRDFRDVDIAYANQGEHTAMEPSQGAMLCNPPGNVGR